MYLEKAVLFYKFWTDLLQSYYLRRGIHKAAYDTAKNSTTNWTVFTEGMLGYTIYHLLLCSVINIVQKLRARKSRQAINLAVWKIFNLLSSFEIKSVQTVLYRTRPFLLPTRPCAARDARVTMIYINLDYRHKAKTWQVQEALKNFIKIEDSFMAICNLQWNEKLGTAHSAECLSTLQLAFALHCEEMLIQ